MMKILLINPKFYIHHPPLGMGYLASYVKKYLSTPVEILLFDEVVVQDDIRTMVCEFDPDLIGISIVTPTFNRAMALCKQIREVTSAPIVAGGPHITAMPDSILNTPIDVGVIGEGEATFLELMQCLLQKDQIKTSKIEGIAYQQGNHIIRTERRQWIMDINTIPFPDRTLFDMQYYTEPKRLAHGLYAKGTSMIPSRGCPFGKCDFCSSSLTWGNVPRFFSPAAVVEEIQAIITNYDTDFILFLDDNFTTNVSWLKSVYTLLKERGLLNSFYFDCESIAAFMDDKRTALLKAMGCVRVEFGFESGCDRILNILKSGKSKLIDHERAIKLCHQHDLAILGNIVIGYIDETPDELKKSIEWFLHHPIDYIAPHLYTPYPGTTGWNECVKRGIINPQEIDWNRFATGSAEENLVVNTVFPEDQLLKRYQEITERISKNNKALVIDTGLSFPEKLRLYNIIRNDSDIQLKSNFFKDIARQDRYHPKAWLLTAAQIYALVGRIKSFLQGPYKIWYLRNKVVPWLPLLSRLPSGGWWFAWNDVMGKHVYQKDNFESGEQIFLSHYLKQGMVIFDVGAHQGLYTLLASKNVGPQGKIIAFEPSPREIQRLQWNLKLNCCRNVKVEPVAVSNTVGFSEFFVCIGIETGGNSLRPPAISDVFEPIQVPTITLDFYIEKNKIEGVDFLKVDAEGAELNIFKGASRLLNRIRPLILCEFADVRTIPWGYTTVELSQLISTYEYQWLSVTTNGQLYPCPAKVEYNENLLAVPKEKLPQIAAYLIKDKEKCTI